VRAIEGALRTKGPFYTGAPRHPQTLISSQCLKLKTHNSVLTVKHLYTHTRSLNVGFMRMQAPLQRWRLLRQPSQRTTETLIRWGEHHARLINPLAVVGFSFLLHRTSNRLYCCTACPAVILTHTASQLVSYTACNSISARGPCQKYATPVYVCVYECVCMCVCAYVRACVRACVRLCVSLSSWCNNDVHGVRFI
jgi:hypothetical protein